ncbi:hypothetical protein M1N92_04125 [Dehalococcoidia bacterium]|nr:hypothetical protein [Dehalococcoidia bacterium]
MKFKPVQLPGKKGIDRKHNPAARRLSDRSEILSYLERERSCCAAAIAHLEPDLWAISKFFVAIHHETFALCLISRSMLHPDQRSHSDFDSILLPGEAFITRQPWHLDAIERHYVRETTLRRCYNNQSPQAIQMERKDGTVWIRLLTMMSKTFLWQRRGRYALTGHPVRCR